MIIWTGFGILLPVVFLAGIFLAIIGNSSLGTPIPKEWGFTLGIVLGTALSWLLSVTIARTTVQIALDPHTRRQVHSKSRHTLFFIPVRFYCWLLTLLSLSAIVLTITAGSPEERAAAKAKKQTADAREAAPLPVLISPTAKFPLIATTHKAVTAYSDDGIEHIPGDTPVTVHGIEGSNYQIEWKSRSYKVDQKDFSSSTIGS